MLIARAPVRISFTGGGTDFEAYYRVHGGLVVSTTIDKYVYVVANANGPDSVQITSANYQTFFRQRKDEPIGWDGNLSLPRAILSEFGIDSGFALFLASEVPPGTGLGSSSAVSVALCKALSVLRETRLSADELARLASYIQIEKLGEPIGLQDQYAAAFGGLNAIRFDPDGGVRVERVRMDLGARLALERRLLLFFTGATRNAASILRHQRRATERHDGDAVLALHQIKRMAERTVDLLERGDLAGFGALLDEAWEAKKRLACGITNPRIDEWYRIAKAHGAAGGKITGAGGGGFLLLCCEEAYQEEVTDALEEAGLTRMDFHFEDGGAMVLMDGVSRGGGLLQEPRARAARANL